MINSKTRRAISRREPVGPTLAILWRDRSQIVVATPPDAEHRPLHLNPSHVKHLLCRSFVVSKFIGSQRSRLDRTTTKVATDSNVGAASQIIYSSLREGWLS